MSRTPLVVAACMAAAGLGVTACGGGGRASTITTAPAATTVTTAPNAVTTAPKAPPDQAALNGALLTISDMPTGFTTTTPPPPSDSPGPCGLPGMHDSRAAHADATFQRQTSIVDVTAISDGVAAYPGGEAVTAMDRAQAGFNACTTWTSTTNGQTVTFNVSPLSFPKLDDQTLALHLTAQPQGGVLSGVTLAGNLVVIRSGDNLAFLVNVGLPVVDPSLTESLARTQADKLKTL